MPEEVAAGLRVNNGGWMMRGSWQRIVKGQIAWFGWTSKSQSRFWLRHIFEPYNEGDNNWEDETEVELKQKKVRLAAGTRGAPATTKASCECLSRDGSRQM
jgi:hypothetical protein